jgi:hypothetical protein
MFYYLKTELWYVKVPSKHVNYIRKTYILTLELFSPTNAHFIKHIKC